MKTFTISKNQILNALNTQPLGANNGAYASAKPFGKTVRVSAAGAIVRSLAESHKSAAKSLLGLSADTFHDVVAYNVSSVTPLATLETAYTDMRGEGKRTPKIRAALTGIVADTFPAKLQISVWGPSSDVVAA
jgi:hypothetical protein